MAFNLDGLRRFRERLVRSKDNLEETLDQDLLRAAENMGGFLVLQLAEGISEDGDHFSPFSPDYAKQLEKEGYPTDLKRFNKTGALYASLEGKIIESDGRKGTVAVSPRGEDNQNKVKGQFSRDGNILELTEENKQAVIDLYLEDRRSRMEI